MFLEHEAHMKDAVFKGLDVRKMEIPFENARQCGPILRYSAVPRPERCRSAS